MRRHRNKLTFVFRSRFRNTSSLNLYRITKLGETYCTRQYIKSVVSMYTHSYGLRGLLLLLFELILWNY